MDTQLQKLIDKVKDYEMSEEECFEQMLSFVWGNSFKSKLSKEDVRKILKNEQV